jgi:hypothetical protein
MTTATRTRSVYWRRRAILTAAASVGLLMLVHSCASSGPPHLQVSTRKLPAVPVTDTYTPTPTPTVAAVPTGAPTAAPTGALAMPGANTTSAYAVTPLPSPAGAVPAKPGATAKPGKGKTAAPAAAVPTAVAPAAAPAVPRCAKTDLGIELRADSKSYSESSKPKFYIGISNIGNAPCRVDLGSIALSFTVRSGPDRIWSSRDCQGKGTHDIRTLAPGQKLWGRSIWNRSRSKPGCATGDSDARPGTYTLDGSAAGVKAQKKVVFRIR